MRGQYAAGMTEDGFRCGGGPRHIAAGVVHNHVRGVGIAAAAYAASPR